MLFPDEYSVTDVQTVSTARVIVSGAGIPEFNGEYHLKVYKGTEVFEKLVDSIEGKANMKLVIGIYQKRYP